MEWDKMLAPPPQGWQKLSARLHRAEAERRREIAFWRVTASVTVAVAILVGVIDFPSRSGIELERAVSGVVSNAQGPAVLVPGTASNVQFYWMTPTDAP